MLAYCSFLLAAYKKHFPLYRLLMVCSLLVFGHSGIYVHLVQVQHQPELYYSASVAIVAIAINAFGFGLNLLAALGFFYAEDAAS